jgi:hypothetical protein
MKNREYETFECNMKNCRFDEQLVSYLYGELEEAERRKFEEHLQVCNFCTDELEAFGKIRFAVSQWRQNDFECLPTPEIQLPENYSQSVLLGLWQNLFSLRWLVLASACLLVVLSLIFFSRQNKDEEIASSNPIIQRELASVKESTTVAKDELTTADEEPTIDSNKASQKESVEISAGEKLSASKTPLKSEPKKNKIKSNRLRPMEKEDSMELFDFQEEENIRLVDVFDEIGGI